MQDWIKRGQKVLIWGYKEIHEYKKLFGLETKGGQEVIHQAKAPLSSHPVNTDVRDIDFRVNMKHLVVSKYPVNTKVIASVKEGLFAGLTPFGRGSIYFVIQEDRFWKKGADRDRWTLNFYQWMLDLRVPGSAGTSVGVGAGTSDSKSVKTEVYDRVLLKNGDTVSGKLSTEKFSVKTSYTSLSFELKQIESVVLEGSGQNVEMIILRNGDKLSGVVGPDTITIKLAGGQQTEIEKDKIKEISVQQ